MEPEIEGSDVDMNSENSNSTNAYTYYDFNSNQIKDRLVMNEPDADEEALLRRRSLSDDGQFIPEAEKLHEAEKELYNLEMERKDGVKFIAENIAKEKNIPYQEAEKEAENLLSTSHIDEAKEKVDILEKIAKEAIDKYYKTKEINMAESIIDESSNADSNKIEETEPSDSNKIEDTEQNKSSDKESKGISKEKGKGKDNNNSIENNESEYSGTATREDGKDKNPDDPDESFTEEILSALKESKKESSINQKIGESSSNT